MNILMVSKYDVQKGGVAEQLILLSRWLTRRGHKVYIYSSHETARSGGIEEGITFFWGDTPGYAHLLRLARTALRLANLCRSTQIDIIHAHGAYRSGLVAALAARLARIPLVVTSHGDLIPIAKDGREKRRRRVRRILGMAAEVTALNEYMKNITTLCGSRTPIIIPNSIDLQYVHNVLTHSEAGSCKNILVMSRLDPRKHVDLVIAAYKEAFLRGNFGSLIICGDGPERNSLLRFAKSLGCSVRDRPKLDELETVPRSPTVLFFDWVSGEKKWRIASMSMFFCLPTESEAFPVVLLEALASRRLVVASDIPPVREFVLENASGILAANSIASWTSAMVDACNRSKSSELGEGLNRRAVRYDIEKIGPEWDQLYSRIATT